MPHMLANSQKLALLDFEMGSSKIGVSITAGCLAELGLLKAWLSRAPGRKVSIEVYWDKIEVDDVRDLPKVLPLLEGMGKRGGENG